MTKKSGLVKSLLSLSWRVPLMFAFVIAAINYANYDLFSKNLRNDKYPIPTKQFAEIVVDNYEEADLTGKLVTFGQMKAAEKYLLN